MKNSMDERSIDSDCNEEGLINIDGSEFEDTKGSKKGKNKFHAFLKEALETSIYLLVVFLVSLFIITFVGQRTVVEGPSMQSTLNSGDNLIVDKLTYRFSEPKRFDIIVFPHAKHEYYIKRIIGLPGETVYISENGDIYINEQKLEENFGKEVIEENRRGLAAEPIVLGEDEYFVLGDNRNHSSDSRFADVGNIKRKNIIGKAWVRIFPFNEFGLIKHR